MLAMLMIMSIIDELLLSNFQYYCRVTTIHTLVIRILIYRRGRLPINCKLVTRPIDIYLRFAKRRVHTNSQ